MLSLIALAAVSAAAPSTAPASVKSGVEHWRLGEYPAAVAAWLPFAAQGDADALFNMGQAYKLGRGVAKDPTIARDYYRKAAVKGHLPAQANLGIALFQAGEKPEAVRWLKTAADRGEPRAQYVFGIAAYNGDGTPKNLGAAYAYLLRAKASGLAQATTALGSIEPVLTPDARAAGTAMAANMANGVAPAIPTQEPLTTRMASAASAALAAVLPKKADVLKAPPAPVAIATSAPVPTPAPVVRTPTPTSSPAVVASAPKPTPAATPPAQIATATVRPPTPAPIVTAAPAPNPAPVVANPPVMTGPKSVYMDADAAKAAAPKPAEIATVDVPTAAAPKPPEVKPAAPVVAAPKPEPVKVAEVKPPAPTGWRVQLGAFSNKKAADEAWTSVKTAQATAIGKAKPIFDTSGPVVKFQLGPFASRDAARDVCAKLAFAGRACFVTQG
ncbi:SPOR domain-containing protein [Glacieibacterium sp.]|uniref:SPOR domain-containing protein n=1 Tax=Glacieibacterium sp. TaxID=2860237 RepID=UPI003B00CCA5